MPTAIAQNTNSDIAAEGNNTTMRFQIFDSNSSTIDYHTEKLLQYPKEIISFMAILCAIALLYKRTITVW